MNFIEKIFAKEGKNYKQVIVVRKDLKMSVGKLCSQVAHASVSAYQRASKKIQKEWTRQGQKKVVVKVSNEKEILELYKNAEKNLIPACLIHDAGLTQVEPGTVTALGIGPDDERKVDAFTKGLKLL